MSNHDRDYYLNTCERYLGNVDCGIMGEEKLLISFIYFQTIYYVYN